MPSSLFTGREYHQVVGLYDYRNRAYDPDLGRFLQRDPPGNWYDPVNFGNAYAYVGGDPGNGRDPWGLDKWIRGGTINIDADPPRPPDQTPRVQLSNYPDGFTKSIIKGIEVYEIEGMQNCHGSACGRSRSIQPVSGKYGLGKFFEKALGYSCLEEKKGAEACKCKCKEEMIFVYIYKYGYNPNNKDPWKEEWQSKHLQNDSHSVRCNKQLINSEEKISCKEGKGQWDQVLGAGKGRKPGAIIGNPDDVRAPGVGFSKPSDSGVKMVRMGDSKWQYCCCRDPKNAPKEPSKEP